MEILSFALPVFECNPVDMIPFNLTVSRRCLVPLASITIIQTMKTSMVTIITPFSLIQILVSCNESEGNGSQTCPSIILEFSQTLVSFSNLAAP